MTTVRRNARNGYYAPEPQANVIVENISAAQVSCGCALCCGNGQRDIRCALLHIQENAPKIKLAEKAEFL